MATPLITWSMRKRRKLVLFSFVGLLLFTCVLYCVETEDPISVTGYQKIQEGMTQQEVEVILGGRAGEYTSMPITYDYCERPRLSDKGVRFLDVWQGNKAEIAVGYSVNGTVNYKDISLAWPDESPPPWSVSGAGSVGKHREKTHAILSQTRLRPA